MNRIICFLTLTIITATLNAENNLSQDYLKKVLSNLEKIESATYWVKAEGWSPGDTIARSIVNEYVESYRNPKDTTVGSSWVIFDNEQKNQVEFIYDGEMRVLIYNDVKGIMIDSFKVRQLPFRPVNPPFYNYTENIIRYIIENNDSTLVEQKDLGVEIYVKLTIYKSRQVEFFGRAHYIPNDLYISDPTSIYELWIDKKTSLPQKVRREMSHDISVKSVSHPEFNKLRLQNFVASDYFPKNYEIRQYGQQGKERQPNELIGKKAPDWTLQTRDKQNISLSDIKSKVLMIQFTSVSCGPCKASIPFLKKLLNEYKNTDFDFVAIECTSTSTQALNVYMKRNDFDYKFLLSTKEVLTKYSITGFPVFFILDENRIIRNVINGYGEGRTDNEIRTLINQLL